MIKNECGHTMIEMMVVVAIIGILAATTSPLGAFWVENSRLTSTVGHMTHGLGKAVGVALRNENVVGADDPVSALCISDTNTLTIIQGGPITLLSCATSTGVRIWESNLSSHVSITDSSGAPIKCICFSSSGLLMTNQCATCLSQNEVVLSIGDKKETLLVH